MGYFFHFLLYFLGQSKIGYPFDPFDTKIETNQMFVTELRSFKANGVGVGGGWGDTKYPSHTMNVNTLNF